MPLSASRTVILCVSSGCGWRQGSKVTVVPNPVKLDSPNDYPSTLIQIERAAGVTLDRVRVQWATTRPNWQRVMHAVDVTDLDIGDRCHLPEPEAASN